MQATLNALVNFLKVDLTWTLKRKFCSVPSKKQTKFTLSDDASLLFGFVLTLLKSVALYWT